MSSLHGFQLALLPYTRVIQANHKMTYMHAGIDGDADTDQNQLLV